jgi:O-antigen/teichoic acid export membrane protein
MLYKLKSLFKDTVLYGFGTIVPKFINYLLFPYYVNVLSVTDNGINTTLVACMAFAIILYTYGMESAYMKYSTATDTDEKTVFSTGQVSLVASGLALSAIIIAFAKPLATIVGAAGQPRLIYYAALVLFLDSLAVIPAARLRMQNKALLFSLVKISNVLVNLGLNVYLLVFRKMGIEGVMISLVAASASSVMLLLPVWINGFTFRFSNAMWKELFWFAVPYVPSGLAAMTIETIDRLMLTGMNPADALKLYNLKPVEVAGIYGNNYKLGVLISILLKMFQFAWTPFFLKTASDPNAKRIFSKVMTLSLFALTLMSLVLSLFVQELVQVKFFGKFQLLKPEYFVGLNIVPIVCLAYLFEAIYVNLIAGVYIQKQTKFLPVATFLGAIVTVAMNIILIPRIGMLGTAITTAVSYGVMAAALFFNTRKFYYIKYEWSKLFSFMSLAAIVIVFSTVAKVDWTLKLIFVVLFMSVSALIFDKEEMTALKKLVMRK